MRIGISLEDFIVNISALKLSGENPGTKVVDFNVENVLDLKKDTEKVLLRNYIKMFFTRPVKAEVKRLISTLIDQGDCIFIVAMQNSASQSFSARLSRSIVHQYLKANGIKAESIVFGGIDNITDICARNDIDAYIQSNGLFQMSAPNGEFRFTINNDNLQEKLAEIRDTLNQKEKKEELCGIPSIDRVFEQYYTAKEKTYSIPKMSMYQFIYMNNMDHLDDIAIRYQENSMTYREFFKRIDMCAASLLQSKVKAGDRVTICMPNMPEAIILFYALNKIGAIAHMMDPRLPQEEMKDRINQVGSKMLFFVDSDPTTKTLNSFDFMKETTIEHAVFVSPKHSLPKVMKVLYTLFMEPKSTHIAPDSQISGWNSFLSRGEGYVGEIPNIYVKDAPAVIINTGGTTGTSKGAVHSNEYYNFIVSTFKGTAKLQRGKEAYGILPIFHIFGLSCAIHIVLSNGATTNLVPKFRPKDMIKTLKKGKTNYVLGVQQILNFMAGNTQIQRMDLSSLEIVVSGGDTITPENEINLNSFLKKVKSKAFLTKGYGITEGGIVVVTKEGSNELGSIGIPLVNTKVKFVNPKTLEEVGYNEKGELCISGPIMLRYYENETETNLAVREHSDGEKWLHTGDIGYVNERGIIFFADRIKQIIISNGHNIYPSEIEKVIMEHSAVQECVVVGIPHKLKGRVPKAHIILKQGIAPTHTIQMEIEKLCLLKLSTDSIPANYKFRGDFPLTLMNKVNRTLLENEDAEFERTIENPPNQYIMRRAKHE